MGNLLGINKEKLKKTFKECIQNYLKLGKNFMILLKNIDIEGIIKMCNREFDCNSNKKYKNFCFFIYQSFFTKIKKNIYIIIFKENGQVNKF